MTANNLKDNLFINNEWKSPHGGTFPVIDPATEQIIHNAPLANAEDVNLAVKAAVDAFTTWSKTTGKERAVFLRKIAVEIKKREGALSELETRNAGKPIKEAQSDIGDTVGCFEYAAYLAEKLDEKQGKKVELPDSKFECLLHYEPVGVVAAIIPWNYPLMMASWKLGPALAAGCTVVLKPSEFTPLTALALGDVFLAAGLPAGVINIVTGDGPNTGQPLAEHPDIAKIAFTGSVSTGAKLMQIAAKDIKHCTLELGGKSPIIVFDDATLDLAVEWVMFGIFTNQGETCSATSRLIVQEGIAKELIEKLKAETEKIVLGNGSNVDTQMGPIVVKQQYEKVLNFIQKGKEAGASLLTGGKRPPHLKTGYFLEPTIFTDVKEDMEIWNEEIFGPVLCVRTFKTKDDAIKIANNSKYGLAGAVLSANTEVCAEVAGKLRTGVVWINCSQPCFVQAPWGGYKQSGVGRELGEDGLNIFLETKQITTYVSDKPLGWYKK